ncbi:MAG: prepilin-type N-terminal cleavage/methylation domain-containing protein [Deltaproteobacteria bacterium]|nr:prepilin-type N-terminal cleavage/methylation domain-containing protein [Deltaproteobacteria bacterium]
MKSEKGFTLVEILVAMGLGTLMLMVIYLAVDSAQRSSTGIESKVVAQQDARGALDLMAMEIRMASYNPNLTPNIWMNPATCVGASASQTYRGIAAATANSIAIEMDLNENSVIGDPNEIISYNYDAVNSYITRETNCGGAQPFLGDIAADSNQKTVLVVNNAAGVPLFRYYNGSGTDISATVVSSPTDSLLGIPAIRRIEISLVVDTVNDDPNTRGKRRIVYSTSVIPRNHIPTYSY